ncbi:MAG: delta-60 repeat domain-containing protein, partial [Gammaproteobacteria bacterium]
MGRSTSSGWLLAVVVAVGCAVVTADISPAGADPGDLDPLFGSGGSVVTDPLGIGDSDRASGVAVQSDGRIVVSTDVTGHGTFSGPLVGYTSSGALDEGFGSGGVAATDVAGCVLCGADMVLQPDDKILVVGAAFSLPLLFSPAVARFNPDGSVDPSFGSGGLAWSPHFDGVGNAVALQPDGKILVHSSGAVTRFNPDGSVDTEWGDSGAVRGATSRPGDDYFLYDADLAVAPDGGVVVAGTGVALFGDEDRRLVMARLEPDGLLDTDFGESGLIRSRDLAGVGEIAIQPDGKIVAAGPAGARFGLMRFHPDGTADQGFGEGGMATATDEARAVAVTLGPNGMIVAAGDTWRPGDSGFDSMMLVARFTSDGALDDRFGDRGVATISNDQVPNGGTAADTALQADGKILVAGRDPGDADVMVHRLKVNTPPTIAVSGRGGCGGDTSATLQLEVADAETSADGLMIAARSSD